MAEKSVRVRKKTAAGTAAIPQPPAANANDIALRAYELFLARGCEHGHDWEDWLAAERELAMLASAPELRPAGDGTTLRRAPERRRRSN